MGVNSVEQVALWALFLWRNLLNQQVAIYYAIHELIIIIIWFDLIYYYFKDLSLLHTRVRALVYASSAVATVVKNMNRLEHSHLHA